MNRDSDHLGFPINLKYEMHHSYDAGILWTSLIKNAQ